ncbi:unnamed protein product, partial [Phaeothamnion confervicola]
DAFSAILTRDFAYNKPDGRVAAAIATAWRVPPSHLLFVGDHRDDLACGRDAGCLTCLVANDENRFLLAEEPGLADFSVENLAELPAIV